MDGMRALSGLVAILACGAAAPARSVPDDPLAYCTTGTNNETLRPLPSSLVARAAKTFRLHHMPAGDVQYGTVMRCMNGQVLICNHGANLPCDKAETDPDLPQGALWCRSNPQADYIPAYITGHDTIFHWRCHDGAPVHVGEAEPIDADGFIARYWKALQ